MQEYLVHALVRRDVGEHGCCAGADIIMQLDDVVPSTTQSPARFEEATHRTTRWLDRCIAAHGRPSDQSLFAIVQACQQSPFLLATDRSKDQEEQLAVMSRRNNILPHSCELLHARAVSESGRGFTLRAGRH